MKWMLLLAMCLVLGLITLPAPRNADDYIDDDDRLLFCPLCRFACGSSLKWLTQNTKFHQIIFFKNLRRQIKWSMSEKCSTWNKNCSREQKVCKGAKNVIFYGTLRYWIAVCGLGWSYMALFGLIGHCMIFYGLVWSFIAMFGLVLCTVILWLYIAFFRGQRSK